MKALSVIRSEGAVTVFRETLWRTRRRWKQARLPALIGQDCPVRYRPAGYYQPCLEGMSETARRAIIEYSDLVLRGEFSLFGYTPTLLGLPPCWSVDFVSGAVWPMVPSESVKVVRNDGSDVKIPWELSRLQFLPVLGKAWRLSKELRYRECAKSLVSDWVRQNPFGRGVNWTVAMEAALRATSLCFLLELLAPFSPEEQGWLASVTRSLWEHLLFIEAKNEFSYLTRSNHYLSNIAGLYCLAIYLDGPNMKARAVRYLRLVQREMQHQVNPDGGDYEASVGYHVLVTQLFTVSLLLMRTQGVEPSPAFLDRLSQMYEYMAALADAQGNLPQVGDCDDGRIELLVEDIEQGVNTGVKNRNSLSVSGLLGLGGYVLGRDFGGSSDDACWIGAQNRAPSPVPHHRGSAPTLFPVTGVGTVRRAKSHLLFFAMPNGIGGKGSHTHNDKLSVILRVNGHELFTDSGTFCYTRDAAKRNYFRSTSAHNTVRIDGVEQNRFSERPTDLFRMRHDAKPNVIKVDHRGDSTQFCATHDGYSRLGVMHRRRVMLTDAAQAIVEDNVDGGGTHCIEALWHLSSLWSVQLHCDHGTEADCSLGGPLAVEIRFFSNAPLQVTSARALISRACGAASEGVVLRVVARALLPFHLKTQVSWACNSSLDDR